MISLLLRCPLSKGSSSELLARLMFDESNNTDCVLRLLFPVSRRMPSPLWSPEGWLPLASLLGLANRFQPNTGLLRMPCQQFSVFHQGFTICRTCKNWFPKSFMTFNWGNPISKFSNHSTLHGRGGGRNLGLKQSSSDSRVGGGYERLWMQRRNLCINAARCFWTLG